MTRALPSGWLRLAVALGVVLLAATAPAQALELPRLTAHVNDYASLLPSEGPQSRTLSVVGLPDGVYFARLRQGPLVSVRRVNVVQ